MRHQRPWRPRRPSSRKRTSTSSQRTQPRLGPRLGGRQPHQPTRTSTPRQTSRSFSRRTKERSPAKVNPSTRRDPTPSPVQTNADNTPDRRSEEGHLREMLTIIETLQQLARGWHHHSKERRREILYEELRVSWLLPTEEARLLADLVRSSGVHLELLLDLRMGIIYKRLTNRLNQVQRLNIIYVAGQGWITHISPYYQSYQFVALFFLQLKQPNCREICVVKYT